MESDVSLHPSPTAASKPSLIAKFQNTRTSFFLLAETYSSGELGASWQGASTLKTCCCSPNVMFVWAGYRVGLKCQQHLRQRSDMALNIRAPSCSLLSLLQLHRTAVHFGRKPSPVEITTRAATMGAVDVSASVASVIAVRGGRAAARNKNVGQR